MKEFVDECRKEWRRLGVPDPIANEMAGDLTADLEEAETEGGSAEDVLGDSAFDPRRFAAAWAGARGVTSPPATGRLSVRRPVVAVLVTAAAAVFVFVAGAALLVGRSSEGVSRVFPLWAGSGPIHIAGPKPGPQAFKFLMPGPVDIRQVTSFDLLALVLFVIGVVGIASAILYWSPWARRRRSSLVP